MKRAKTNIAEIYSDDQVLSNIDLLTQILLRVPPEPLITLRTVSKHWLSIISDPDFIATHTRHHLTNHPQSSVSLFHYGSVPLSIQDGKKCKSLPKFCVEAVRNGKKCKSLPIESLLKILSPCNGLTLCLYGYYYPNYIVLNLTTQKHRVLPDPLPRLESRQQFNTVLAFDPLKSFHYKVIRFRSIKFPDPTVDIDIFSSESGVWKTIHFQDPPGGVSPNTRMIFWNGAIHWIASLDFHVSFVVDEEKFTRDQILSDSDTNSEEGKFGYFGKSDNGLLLVQFSSRKYYCEGGFYYHVADDVFTVLEMDRDNCWSPKHLVDLKPLVSEYPGMDRFPEDGRKRLHYSVLYVKSGNKNGDFSMVLSIENKFIFYEVRKANGGNDSKVLYEYPFPAMGVYQDMHPLIECLAPVL